MGNSKSRLRKALLFLDTTDRVPDRTAAVAHSGTDAEVEEAVGVAGVVAVWS